MTEQQKLMAAGADVSWTVKVYGVPEYTIQGDNAAMRKFRTELVAKGIPAKLAVWDEEFFAPKATAAA